MLLQCQGIAESYQGSVIDENAMAGYVKTRAQKTSTMALNFQNTNIQLFHKMTMYFPMEGAALANKLR